MLHGWSAAAGLTCDVFKAPCEEMAQWVQICGSLRPGDAPNVSPTTARSAFPELEPAAAELAMTVARAVVRNDVPMLLGTFGPKGLKIGKKTYTAEALQAALAERTVLGLVAPIYGDLEDDPGSLFNWHSGPAKSGQAKVWFSSGYGEQAYFILKKTGDDWHLVAFGVYDLGEP